MGGSAVKGPLLVGIDRVSERIRTGRLKVVRRDCLPLISEAHTYAYDVSRQSEEPEKHDDHSMDSLRYLCVGLSRGSGYVAPIEPDPPVPDPNDIRSPKYGWTTDRDELLRRNREERAERMRQMIEADDDDPRWSTL
jgi:hypothetical protein